MSDLNRKAAEILWGDPIQNKNGNMKYWDKENYTMRDGNSFDPCNRIEHAWMLVEWATSEKGWLVNTSTDQGETFCYVYKDGESDDAVWKDPHVAHEPEAPLAITQAILEACDE